LRCWLIRAGCDSFNAITLHVLDAYMDAPQTDWIGAYAASAHVAAAMMAQASATQAEHAADAKPALPLASYAGSYRDSWLGTVDIRVIQGTLCIRFTASPRLQGSLSVWRGNSFLVRRDERTLNADAIIDFGVDQQPGLSGAHMRRASPRTARAYDCKDLNLVRDKAPAR
jgi:Domain of unknown function (DUF3471)